MSLQAWIWIIFGLLFITIIKNQAIKRNLLFIAFWDYHLSKVGFETCLKKNSWRWRRFIFAPTIRLSDYGLRIGSTGYRSYTLRLGHTYPPARTDLKIKNVKIQRGLYMRGLKMTYAFSVDILTSFPIYREVANLIKIINEVPCYD